VSRLNVPHPHLVLAILIWSLLVGASFLLNAMREREEVFESARADAVTHLNKDISFRRWGTRHGGVYVPVSPEQQPVPWLAHLPNRDVRTSDGRALTLINPAMMMRQVMEDYAAEFGVTGRITGLRYLNPVNAPDAWERTQLESFARGERRETFELVEFKGRRHLRYLRAMWMEPGCDQCHAILGYKTGDFRGATGVNLPLAPYENRVHQDIVNLGLTHGLIWLAGLAGIGFSARGFGQRQAALRRSEKRFRDLFENSPDPCWLIRSDDVVDCNRAAVELLGYRSRADVLDNLDRLSPERQPDGQKSIDKAAAMSAVARQHGVHRFEWEHRRADGSCFPVEVTLAKMDDDEGQLIYAVWRDITARKAAETALRAERDRSQLYLDTVQSVIVALDTEGRISMVNPFGCELLGYRADELVGRNWFETCLPQPAGSEAVLRYFRRLMLGEIAPEEYFENELVTRDGRHVLIAWHNALLRDGEGRIIGALSAGEDITVRRAAEEEVHSLAFFDPLTGLPNRRLLLDRLQQSMVASARSDRHRALFYLDLDRFKVLNDTLGHDIGDRLLVEVATRLRSCVREIDTVSRLGGDEFVVLLEQLSGDRDEAARQASAVGDKIIARLREPCDLSVDTYRGTTSVGVALFIGQEASVEELLKRADLAMYQAKAAGRNTLRFFDPEMQANLSAHAVLEKELRHAIVDAEFVMHYQPQVDAMGTCVGVEALLRWQHRERGQIPPNEFIPVAEETGLIVPIGRWVLHHACQRLKAWESDPATAPIAIAVNVSARQFREAGFIDDVLDLVEFSRINPRRLKIEITESMLVDDIDEVVAKMSALQAIGVNFALDDFGTGYSSLSYVKKLPLDQLKIDRSFVRDVLVDPNDAAICRAIIALGQTLGLETIAEGVETDAQWDFLTAGGCTLAQGYHFARPMPEAEFRNWLASRRGTVAG
jgi:diguanylate cyclase (GGDEF)-like protein/PAS domain S-box-containing protein